VVQLVVQFKLLPQWLPHVPGDVLAWMMWRGLPSQPLWLLGGSFRMAKCPSTFFLFGNYLWVGVSVVGSVKKKEVLSITQYFALTTGVTLANITEHTWLPSEVLRPVCIFILKYLLLIFKNILKNSFLGVLFYIFNLAMIWLAFIGCKNTRKPYKFFEKLVFFPILRYLFYNTIWWYDMCNILNTMNWQRTFPLIKNSSV